MKILAPAAQRRERLLKLFIFLLAISAAFFVNDLEAAAQPKTMSAPNAGGVTFKPVSELNQDTASPKLGNADPADPTQWLASFFSWSGQFECTSTLIGP